MTFDLFYKLKKIKIFSYHIYLCDLWFRMQNAMATYQLVQ